MRAVSFGIAVCAGALGGCEAYRERQLEVCHPETGCRPRPFWPDADGDGWGVWDPIADRSEIAVDPPDGFVANQMDCDDDRAELTADVAGLCPASFVPGAEVTGRVGEGVELVVVGPAVASALQAEDLCGTPGWGGSLGALPTMLGDLPDPAATWVASSPDALGPEWDGAAGLDALVEGPVLWEDGALRSAPPTEAGRIACVRPTPDPVDHQTPAGPP